MKTAARLRVNTIVAVTTAVFVGPALAADPVVPLMVREQFDLIEAPPFEEQVRAQDYVRLCSPFPARSQS